MRYIGIWIIMLLAGPVFGYNEVVSAISYNPSRLGVYRYLKAVDGATLKGGLVIDKDNNASLHMRSTGTITFTDHTSNSMNNSTGYRVYSDEAHNKLNQFIAIEPKGGTGATQTSTVSAEKAVLQKATSSPRSSAYVLGKSGTDATFANKLIPNLKIMGDTSGQTLLTMKNPSYVRTLTHKSGGSADKLDVVTLNATTKLTVTQIAYVANQLKLGNITVAKPATNPCPSGKSPRGYEFKQRVSGNNLVSVLTLQCGS